MGQWLNIFGFLAVILRATTLLLQSFAIGGVVFRYAVLGRQISPSPDRATAACDAMLRWIGLALALFQAVNVICESLILSDSGLALREIAGANFFLAGIAVIIGGLLIALAPAKLRHATWFTLPVISLILAATVTTSHAFGRVNARGLVMALTALHLVATGCWIGGLPYLFISLKRISDPMRKSEIVRRYSQIAFVSVSTLVISGLWIAWHYVGSLPALYGTAYGIMLVAKVVLLGSLLFLGALNRAIVKRSNPMEIHTRLQHFVTAEIGIGIAAVLTAASMTSQPPAIDLTTDRVNAATILSRLEPRWPRLRTPPVTALSPASRPLEKQMAAKNQTSFVPGAAFITPNSPSDIAWSEYNHNWMGLLLIVIGFLAVLARTGRVSLARHWPLAFLLMGIFIFLRADPENWPLGPNGFWESFDQVEILQHRTAVLLLAAFAIFEWRVQLGKSKWKYSPLVFPSACILGGMLLVTHSHALGNLKEELLAEMSHLPLALAAIFAGWARYLQLKLPNRDSAVASWVWPVCFVLIGTILLTYREA